MTPRPPWAAMRESRQRRLRRHAAEGRHFRAAIKRRADYNIALHGGRAPACL